MIFKILPIFVLILCVYSDEVKQTPEEKAGVKYANDCEACKILAIELQARLEETGKTHEVLEMGYSLDKPKKTQEYVKSQLRLIESTENVCDRVLEYNMHKERKDSTRFAKGMSQTFTELHGLVNRGVKVELGIPEELWDKPSEEVTQLKKRCESLLERHENDIEDWYFREQSTGPLIDYLCRDRVLSQKDSACLYEVFVPKEKDNKTKTAEKPKKKKKKSKKAESSVNVEL
ncbi:unnamed protein product [Diamesa serratosioi]